MVSSSPNATIVCMLPTGSGPFLISSGWALCWPLWLVFIFFNVEIWWVRNWNQAIGEPGFYSHFFSKRATVPVNYTLTQQSDKVEFRHQFSSFCLDWCYSSFSLTWKSETQRIWCWFRWRESCLPFLNNWHPNVPCPIVSAENRLWVGNGLYVSVWPLWAIARGWISFLCTGEIKVTHSHQRAHVPNLFMLLWVLQITHLPYQLRYGLRTISWFLNQSSEEKHWFVNTCLRVFILLGSVKSTSFSS